MHILKLFPRLLFVLLLTATVVFAQDDATPTPTPQNNTVQSQQPNATPAPVSSPAPSPVVTAKIVPRVIQTHGHLELDDILEVQVENLEPWTAANASNDPTKLVPYINGRAIRGNYPDELHVDRGRLIYHLRIAPENKEVWIDLLGAPDGVTRPVTLSVGLENGSAFDSIHERDNRLALTVISPVYGIVAALIIVAIGILLLWLVRKSNIIR